MSNGGVMLTGWLKKSPPEKKMRRHQSWKKRWFMLKSGRLTGDPNLLEYYKHQSAKKPIKSINLNDCIQIDINVPIKPDKKDPAQQFVFDIVTNSRTFYFVADSVREMSSWVHCLCDLCGFSHDANDKTNLGTEQQAFTAQSQMNGSAPKPLMHSDINVPDPIPRPGNTITPRSEPIEDETSNLIGKDNGYDIPEESIPICVTTDPSRSEQSFSDWATYMQSQKSMEDGPGGYIHLTECESATANSDLLLVHKNDGSRVSTDSVFTHEGVDEDTPLESPMNPMINPLPPKSRFLKEVQDGRLSSMPDCPPPLPPTNVPPVRRYGDFPYPREFDEDMEDVTVAKRRNPRSAFNTGPLPPIDDIDLYKVPINMQREHRVNEDGRPSATGSTGGASCSSYGSTGGYGGDRRSSGKFAPVAPEYINTSDAASSGSTTSQFPSASGSSLFSSSSLTPHDKSLYDTPSPLASPVFPLNLGARATQSNIGRNLPGVYLKPEKQKIVDCPMLDVSRMDQPSSGLVVPSQPNSIYSAPNSLPVYPNSAGASRQDKPPAESLYSVPPARPPKPSDPSMNEANVAFPMNTKATSNHVNKYQESLYVSPRTPSSSSSSSYGRDTFNVENSQHVMSSVYDTVKQPSPLSPVHATVIGTVSDDHRSGSRVQIGPLTKKRNAISASNSPMATPNMSRRRGAGDSINEPVHEKGVSGSAPSLYDVPQCFSRQTRSETRSSHSSSTSADSSLTGSFARNSEMSHYEIPKPLSMLRRTSSPKPNTFDDDEHPSYEKMAAQHLPSPTNDSGAVDSDASLYTIMSGAGNLINSKPVPFASPHHHPAAYPPQSWPKDIGGPDIPPPVHRELKPKGRVSLGSDGGGSDKRKPNSRNSYESDEAVSPPHTTITRTLPMVNEPKSSSRYGPVFTSLPTPNQATESRSNSITSPLTARSDTFNERLSPMPPQRPPKSINASLSPRSPPMATPVSQLPGRPYTPTHGSHSAQQDRKVAIISPLPQGVPKRPPKPANMKHSDKSNTQVWDDGGFSPPQRPPKFSDDLNTPSRPPKSSMTTPSSSDSLCSAVGHHSFFPRSSSFNSATIVPVAPVNEQVTKEIKYIDFNDFDFNETQNSSPVHPATDVPDRSDVQYIQLDADRTRALEEIKAKRKEQRDKDKFK